MNIGPIRIVILEGSLRLIHMSLTWFLGLELYGMYLQKGRAALDLDDTVMSADAFVI